VTDRPLPLKGVFNYLANLADAKPSPADYAIKVREVFDVLVKDTCDATAAQDFLLSQVSAQCQLGLVSKQHYELVTELLPKPSAKGRGRPKKARGKRTYRRKYRQYLDWRYASTLDPSLTKEQFAKRELGITDEQLSRDYGPARARVDAFLQGLKPARMTYLDEGQREAIDKLYRFVLGQDRMRFARDWREAKQGNPALTKEEFVRNDLKWAVSEIAEDLIREQLEYLEHGEQLLTVSERG
jgi:hypothetical protein